MTVALQVLTPAPDESLNERRTAWLAARKTHLTATDAGKILTGRGLEVWMDKRNLSTDAGPTPGYMRRGSYLERGVLQWYADVHEVSISFPPPFTLIEVAGLPLFAATLDAQRDDDARPVDAKTIAVRDQFDPEQGTGWGEDGTDQFPLAYAAQLLIQMAATNTERADLAVVFGFSGLVTFHLGRDREVEGNVFAKLQRWWQRHIVEGVLPEADGSEAFTEYLKKFVHQESDVMREATDAEEEIALQFMVNREVEKKAKEEKESDGNALRAAIGENAGLRSSLMKATWKARKDGSETDWEAVARDLSELIETGNLWETTIARHTRIVPGSRTLLVTPTKEKAR